MPLTPQDRQSELSSRRRYLEDCVHDGQVMEGMKTRDRKYGSPFQMVKMIRNSIMRMLAASAIGLGYVPFVRPSSAFDSSA